jgi:hypothetical protein
MMPRTRAPAFWQTATCGGPVATSPQDLLALGEHLGNCQHTHRHWFTLHDMASATHGFVSTRFVSTLVVIVLLISIADWLI